MDERRGRKEWSSEARRVAEGEVDEGKGRLNVGGGRGDVSSEPRGSLRRNASDAWKVTKDQLQESRGQLRRRENGPESTHSNSAARSSLSLNVLT